MPLLNLIDQLAVLRAGLEAAHGLVAEMQAIDPPNPVLFTPNHQLQGVSRHAHCLRRYLKLRRYRNELLGGGDLFADPAWDMLLDLYHSNLIGRRISVSSACIAAQVPPTTALRWIGVLENRALVTRHRDDHDGRLKYLELTPIAVAALEIWCRTTFGPNTPTGETSVLLQA